MKKIALLCLLLSPLSHADNIRDDQTNISYRYSDSTIGLELHKIYYNSGFILDYKLGGSLRHDIDTQQDYGFFALMGGKGYGRHAPNEFFLGVEFGIDKVGKGAIGMRTDFLFRPVIPVINEKLPLTAGIALDYSINTDGLDTGTLALTVGWNIYSNPLW
jgi:hypothetical protein